MATDDLCRRCQSDGVIYCDRCNGSGRAIGDVADCPDCKGAGNLGPVPTATIPCRKRQ